MYRFGASKGMVGYKYGKIDYTTIIPDLPKSRHIHKTILYLTLLEIL